MKQVNESLTVSPFFLFFLVHSTQTGVALLNFQSKIIKGAEQEAWISLLLVSLSFHLIIWFMFFILKKSKQGDIISLHQQLFGRWIGNVMNLFFYGYMLLSVSTIIRLYLSLLITWVFPYTPLWLLSIVLIFVITYVVMGGFRVITGICFWGVVIPTLLLTTIYFPLQYSYWTNLLPVFNHSLNDYFTSAKNSVLLFTGPEFLLIYFPFIKNNERSQKWVHLSQAYTTILYLLITIVSFVYFSHGQLEHTLWPTLIITKIINLPFVERFEYIYIFTWLLVILPPCCIALWGGIRILTESFKFKSRMALWMSIIIVHFIIINVRSRTDVDNLGSFLNVISSSFVYIYIPLLFLILITIQAVNKIMSQKTNL